VELEQDRAFYSPSKDKIVMPLRTQFSKLDKFYHTLFHEMVHSTGHDTRLNREGVATANMLNKTKNDYAFEELIAESGAMMLSGIAGIDTKDEDKQSQAYVNGWVKAVNDADAKAVVSALTKSTKAIDYILGE
jgi:antirestriction protein ArdC